MLKLDTHNTINKLLNTVSLQKIPVNTSQNLLRFVSKRIPSSAFVLRAHTKAAQNSLIYPPADTTNVMLFRWGIRVRVIYESRDITTISPLLMRLAQPLNKSL